MEPGRDKKSVLTRRGRSRALGEDLAPPVSASAVVVPAARASPECTVSGALVTKMGIWRRAGNVSGDRIVCQIGLSAKEVRG